jgi:PAS domain S-box-containing protein
MVTKTLKSRAQEKGEAIVDDYRHDLGPFVVATEKTRMPMVFIDEKPGHPVIFANDAFLALTGYTRDEVLAKSFKTLLVAGMDAETMRTVEAAFRGECDTDPELHYRRKDKSEFWASMLVSPVCDDNGRVVQHFVSFIDLTKRRHEDALCAMLIDELNHRVKNTLSTVQAIIAQALRQPSEPAVIREAVESRILALSRSHDLLTKSSWEGAGLHDLVVTALHPFHAVSGGAERVSIRGENVLLLPKTVLALSIAINELATNSIKFGAFSNDIGTIEIDWTTCPEAAGDRLRLQWREHDGPLVAPPIHRGFGLWVLERGLPHELNGKVTLDYQNHGVSCTIDLLFPAERDR